MLKANRNGKGTVVEWNDTWKNRTERQENCTRKNWKTQHQTNSNIGGLSKFSEVGRGMGANKIKTNEREK